MCWHSPSSSCSWPAPLPIAIALAGSQLDRKERFAAAWFGPKGFASVVYGLLIYESGVDRNSQMFHLIAVVVTVSILLHSSTDVIVARWFEPGEGPDHPPDDPNIPDVSTGTAT